MWRFGALRFSVVGLDCLEIGSTTETVNNLHEEMLHPEHTYTHVW